MDIDYSIHRKTIQINEIQLEIISNVKTNTKNILKNVKKCGKMRNVNNDEKQPKSRKPSKKNNRKIKKIAINDRKQYKTIM